MNFENKIFQDDCLNIMPLLPDNCIDMVLCDLPYGLTHNKWDSVIPLDKLWEQYNRIVKPNGAIVLTSQGLFTAKLMLSNASDFKYKIVWVKSIATNFLNAKKQPLRKYEDICVFYKKQPTYNPQKSIGDPYKVVRKQESTPNYNNLTKVSISESKDGSRYPTDVIYFKTVSSEGHQLHPTQKPVELGRYLIRTYTKQGDIVLDNACGVGSFCVAAKLENRRYIGIEKAKSIKLKEGKEIDPVQIAKERVKF